ncbi:MAG: DUF721 domain-containing protein [Treponema sp.]|nr:DUF721 domain-containing protein [Treponema sp.]
MSDDAHIISAADMIMHVFSRLDKNSLEQSNKLFGSWQTVVSKIKSQERTYGEQLVAHTEPLDLKNGVLLVEADHPGWIQILQLYSNFIITGLQHKAPELGITSLAFRLKGSNSALSYDEQLASEQQKLSKKLDEEDKRVNNRQTQECRTETALPQELQEKFAEMKKRARQHASR